MTNQEIIRRLKYIAAHAIHTVREPPFVMSIDDGIAVHEAISALEAQELANNSTKLDRDSGEFVTILDCTGCRYEFRADYCCQYCVRSYKDRYVKRDDQEESV